MLKSVNMAKKSEKPTANNQSSYGRSAAGRQLTTKLSWLPKKTFELEFSIPWNKVKKFYQETLKKVAAETTIKGFRKGKAPIPLVEKNVDKSKVYQEVLKRLLPITYVEAIKKHNLRPIVNPKIQPISIKENEEWKFKAISCETPEIKLGDYQKHIKGALAKEKIWTPDKGTSGKENKKESAGQSYNRKLKTVTTILLDNIKVELPNILVEDEVNKMLSRFLDQVNRLGMTIDQYLASKNMTSEQLRADYKKTAEDTLTMEFILAAIMKDRQIKVEKEEIDKMIKAAPDEKIRKQLNTPEQRAYIAHILAKRKTIDFLLSL